MPAREPRRRPATRHPPGARHPAIIGCLAATTREDTTMIATKETTRTGVLVGRLERDKIMQGLSLGFALLVSAILNLWNLAQNGYGNEYYATAVQSMLLNWKNFFFASYDAGGFI